MSHRAAFTVEKGFPIVVQERVVPSPSDDQVLVRVRAAGVNAVDPLQRDLGLFVAQFPTVGGYDGAGVVEKVGANVTKFEVGDRILFEGFGSRLDEATFQEYTLARPDLAAKIPPSLSDVEAATIPVAFGTSFTALFSQTGAGIKPPFTEASVSSGSSIVIIGGSGSMGQMGIQLARLAGFETIITTASKEHEEYLKGLGATHVLDRHSTSDAKSVSEIAADVNLVYDTISQPSTYPLTISILRNGGTLVRTIPYQGADLPSNISVKSIAGLFHINTFGEGPPAWSALEKWLEAGLVKPNRPEVFEGIEKVDEAVTRQAKGVSGVKVVVKFD